MGLFTKGGGDNPFSALIAQSVFDYNNKKITLNSQLGTIIAQTVTNDLNKKNAANSPSASSAPSAAPSKSPDVSSIKKKNAETASGNTPSNMLTGPVGINPNALSLGKSSVLGS